MFWNWFVVCAVDCLCLYLSIIIWCFDRNDFGVGIRQISLSLGFGLIFDLGCVCILFFVCVYAYLFVLLWIKLLGFVWLICSLLFGWCWLFVGLIWWCGFMLLRVGGVCWLCFSWLCLLRLVVSLGLWCFVLFIMVTVIDYFGFGCYVAMLLLFVMLLV